MIRRLTFLCLLAQLSVSTVIAQHAPATQAVLDITSMDKTIDPCTDFFTYSCGGWIKQNPIPPDETSWSAYSKLEIENKTILREILENAAKPGAAHDATTQKIGDYYAACMNETAINNAGLKPLQSDLTRIASLQSKADLASLLASTTSLYRDPWFYRSTLFRFSSEQDAKASTQTIALADQGGLGLPDRDYYTKTDEQSVKLRNAYVAHVEKMFELLGDSKEAATTRANTVLRMETMLAQGSLTRLERRDPQKLYHKMSVQELQGLTPQFQWQAFLGTMGLGTISSLNVAAPEFFKTVNQLIEKEDLDSWKAYLRWRLINLNARFLSADFVNSDFDFYGKTLQGAQEIEPRWKRCVSYVDDQMGEALGQAYVARRFSPDAKQRAQKMVTEIEAAMQEDINALTWMSPETKKRALEKLHTVANKIGYPDKWRDYSTLDIQRDDEFGNALRARIFEDRRQLNKIGKPLDRGEWDMTPPTVNAYYDAQMNDINFPAGILQPPLFDAKSDAAPNFGDTGGTIGHELTHGFDDEGRQFDAEGNLKDWWTKEDAKAFDERASCISDQYSQYVVVDDIKINGKLTLGEDIADLGGLFLAYMAWQDDTKGLKSEPLEGFTPAQRFFIAYGQSWCASTRDETKRLRATVDPHSPDKYRANGVVSNMPEFQEAFHCKAGAPMVRANRCRVW